MIAPHTTSRSCCPPANSRAVHLLQPSDARDDCGARRFHWPSRWRWGEPHHCGWFFEQNEKLFNELGSTRATSFFVAAPSRRCSCRWHVRFLQLAVEPRHGCCGGFGKPQASITAKAPQQQFAEGYGPQVTNGESSTLADVLPNAGCGATLVRSSKVRYGQCSPQPTNGSSTTTTNTARASTTDGWWIRVNGLVPRRPVLSGCDVFTSNTR